MLTGLSNREREIVRLISSGLSNKEIGRRLSLSDKTVKVHLHNIYQKLSIHNRTALAVLAIDSEQMPFDRYCRVPDAEAALTAKENT